MEINVKRWAKNEITRYYLTDEAGEDLGFAQEVTVTRGNNSSYDQHRNAKGDIYDTKESHTVESDDVYNAITFSNVTGHRVLDFTKLSNAAGGEFYNPWAKKGEKKSGFRKPTSINTELGVTDD
tara:strand:+ start:5970 stop:6341 length:372 start_codon:yes stop_codon:yes gene_type:complete